jgi:hypothetical protein
MNCRAIFDCTDAGAAWTEVHHRHSPRSSRPPSGLRGRTLVRPRISPQRLFPPQQRTSNRLGRVRGKRIRSRGRKRPGISRAGIAGRRRGFHQKWACAAEVQSALQCRCRRSPSGAPLRADGAAVYGRGRPLGPPYKDPPTAKRANSPICRCLTSKRNGPRRLILRPQFGALPSGQYRRLLTDGASTL